MNPVTEVLIAILLFCPLLILALWAIQAPVLIWAVGWKRFKKLEDKVKLLEAKMEEVSWKETTKRN